MIRALRTVCSPENEICMNLEFRLKIGPLKSKTSGTHLAVRLAFVPAKSKVSRRLVEFETETRLKRERERKQESKKARKQERKQERTLRATSSNLTRTWLNSERFLLGFTMLQLLSWCLCCVCATTPFWVDHACGVAFGNITPPSGPFPVRIHVRATGMNSNTLTARVIHTAGLRFEAFFLVMGVISQIVESKSFKKTSHEQWYTGWVEEVSYLQYCVWYSMIIGVPVINFNHIIYRLHNRSANQLHISDIYTYLKNNEEIHSTSANFGVHFHRTSTRNARSLHVPTYPSEHARHKPNWNFKVIQSSTSWTATTKACWKTMNLASRTQFKKTWGYYFKRT